MRYQYRVTKYDPAFRNVSGAYTRDEWTSQGDIGRSFNGVILQESEYLDIEESYLFAIKMLLQEAKIETLILRGFENHAHNKLPSFIQPEANLKVAQCLNFSRLALREKVWGRLIIPSRAFIHFGYDYYMYVGLPTQCKIAVKAIEERGLFVERCRSPYLRKPLTLHSSGSPTATR